MTFRGLPPFLPFLRAAAALASVVALPPTFPPRRPNATACGFLRGTANQGARDMRADALIAGVAQRLVLGDAGAQGVGGEPVDLRAGALSLLQHGPELGGVPSVSGPQLVRRELCEEVVRHGTH